MGQSRDAHRLEGLGKPPDSVLAGAAVGAATAPWRTFVRSKTSSSWSPVEVRGSAAPPRWCSPGKELKWSSLLAAPKAATVGHARSKPPGGRALFVRADASQAAEVHRLVKTTVDCWGRLDCAFNNAAAVEELEGRAEIARYSEMIAAGRIGRPQEAAEAARWLSSDAAS